MAFSFHRTVTMDHTQAGSVDTTDWPMLFSFTNNDFKTVGNGGEVQNSSGFDLCFTSDSGGTSFLKWEMVSYDGVNGVVLAWVKIPTLSHTSDTVIYVQYGDSGISTFQGGTAGAAWNSNYWQVYHLGEAASPYKDSTANARDSNAGTDPTQASGNGTLGKAQSFNGSSQYIQAPNEGLSPTPASVSGWVKFTSTTMVIVDTRVTSAQCGYILYSVGSGGHPQAYFNNTGPITGGSAVNDGAWHHFIAVNQGGTGTFKLYVDGASVASVTGGTAANVTIGSLRIGATSDGSILFGAQTIQEVRISNHDLTGQLLADYNSQKSSQNMVTLGAGGNTTTNQTITGQSSIAVKTNQTILGQADIRITTNRTITGQSDIGGTTNQTILGQSDIQKTTQQDILGQSDIQVTTKKDITGQSDIQVTTNQTITGQADIQAPSSQVIQGQSDIRIQTNQTILGQTDIQSTVNKIILGQSFISAITNRTIPGQSDIRVTTNQTIQGQADIVQKTNQTITGQGYIFRLSSCYTFETITIGYTSQTGWPGGMKGLSAGGTPTCVSQTALSGFTRYCQLASSANLLWTTSGPPISGFTLVGNFIFGIGNGWSGSPIICRASADDITALNLVHLVVNLDGTLSFSTPAGLLGNTIPLTQNRWYWFQISFNLIVIDEAGPPVVHRVWVDNLTLWINGLPFIGGGLYNTSFTTDQLAAASGGFGFNEVIFNASNSFLGFTNFCFLSYNMSPIYPNLGFPNVPPPTPNIRARIAQGSTEVTTHPTKSHAVVAQGAIELSKLPETANARIAQGVIELLKLVTPQPPQPTPPVPSNPPHGRGSPAEGRCGPPQIVPTIIPTIPDPPIMGIPNPIPPNSPAKICNNQLPGPPQNDT